jgi:hypothetical protein
MSEDRQPEIKYVRKRLYVTDDQTPALSVDDDGYVRCGLTVDMRTNDMLVLGLVLSLKNKKWKADLIERVKEKMEGATTPTSRSVRIMELLGDD